MHNINNRASSSCKLSDFWGVDSNEISVTKFLINKNSSSFSTETSMDLNENLPFDHPSKWFCSENIGKFRNNELEIASPSTHVNDNILQCYVKHLINKSENPESFMLIESSFLEHFERARDLINLSLFVSELKHQKVFSFQSIHLCFNGNF